MSRYIDADEYKRDLIQLGFLPALVVSVLDKQPTTDVLEVVRCRDCVYADCLPSGLFRCRKHSVHSMFRNSILNVRHDDYCSFGERRENGT